MVYEHLLQNPLFVSRYIDANISWRTTYLKGKRSVLRVFKMPYAQIMKKYFLRKYFEKRVLEGIVDIPYLELVLTTKCTLRCESCNNLMQYFSNKNQYTCTLEGMIESLEELCSKISSIQRLRIIGGEPLLFKDMPELMKYLDSQDKILAYDIVTNATINIKEDILKVMKKSKKFMKVSISDYSHVENIHLKQDSIFKNLKKYRIPYSFLTGGIWYKVERIFKRNRDKEGIIKNFLACRMPCVGLMSAEGIRNEKEAHKLAPKGAIFTCPVSSSLSRLRGLEEFNGDFINLTDSSDRILEFYAQNYYKACDYCQDWSKPRENIVAAIQTKEVLEMKNPEDRD